MNSNITQADDVGQTHANELRRYYNQMTGLEASMQILDSAFKAVRRTFREKTKEYALPSVNGERYPAAHVFAHQENYTDYAYQALAHHDPLINRWSPVVELECDTQRGVDDPEFVGDPVATAEEALVIADAEAKRLCNLDVTNPPFWKNNYLFRKGLDDLAAQDVEGEIVWVEVKHEAVL